MAAPQVGPHASHMENSSSPAAVTVTVRSAAPLDPRPRSRPSSRAAAVVTALASSRRRPVCGVLALGLVLAVTGCGDTGSDTPTAATSADSSARGTPTADDRAAMGIDEVTWPGELEQAEALFDRMPGTLAGAEARRPRIFRGAAGVVYGGGDRAGTWGG